MPKQRENGTLVGKFPHEKCGSSDALAVYLHDDGTHSGYCWSCNDYERDPFGDNKGEPRVTQPVQVGASINWMQQKLTAIAGYQCIAIPHRKLRADIAAYYGIKAGISQVDGQSITHLYYPRYEKGRIVSYKERTLDPKNFMVIGTDTSPELVGMQQAKATGAKRLYITEGEDDMAVLFQVLLDNAAGTKWEAWLPAVTSLPNGAKHVVEPLSNSAAEIATFEEIILVLDNDAVGQEAVDKILQYLPLNKTKIVRLPMKDVCEMYEADRQVQLVKMVLWKAETPKIASVATAKEIKELAKTPPVWGVDWPWPSLTKVTYGLRPGLIGVGAGVGVGKTSLWHQTQQALLFNSKQKCGLFMLEEPNEMTLKKLASKQAGIDFTNPELNFTQEQLSDAIDMIPDDLAIYRHKGTKDWADIKQAIKHMVLVDDVKFIFIDPLTALVAHLASSEANDALNAMFAELAGMIEDLNFTCLYGAHLNPPKTGASHEEGGKVLLSQFTGSKAMIKWSHYIFGIGRNTQAPDKMERNSISFWILKDRDFGRTGQTLSLRYDEETGRIIEQTVPVAPPVEHGQPQRAAY